MPTEPILSPPTSQTHPGLLPQSVPLTSEIHAFALQIKRSALVLRNILSKTENFPPETAFALRITRRALALRITLRKMTGFSPGPTLRSGYQPPLETSIPPSIEPSAPPPAAPPAPHQTHGLLPALQSLFYIIVIAIFIITFTLQPFRIPSGSMEPTLLIGDFLLVDKHSLGFDESDLVLPATSIHRGEIIIFHYPIDPAMHLIKRVVGIPGDHLRLHDGRVYINGQPLTEPYAVYRPTTPDNFRDNFPRLQTTSPDIDPAWWIKMHQLVDHGELIIPTGNYFVLGDNRNGSEDSRYWGFVPRSAIVGKPMVIYFSLPPDQTDDPTPFPSAHPHPWLEAVLDFARWNRIFHIPN